jgi:hypothetical protein
MSSLFDEKEADTIVRAVELLHNKKVIIINKEDAMRFIKGDDGKVYQVTGTQEVTRQELENRVHQAETALAAVQAELAEFDKLSGAQHEQPNPDTTAAPSVGQSTPAVPATANQNETVPAIPEANATPTGTEVAPATPAEAPGEQPPVAPQAGTPEQAPSPSVPPQISMQ